MNEIIELYIFSLIFQITAVYAFGKIISKKANLKMIHYISIISAPIIPVITSKLELVLISLIFTIIYFYILFQKIYKCTKLEARNYSIIIWTFSLLFDLVVMLGINVLDMSPLIETNKTVYTIFGTGMMSINLIVLVNIKKVVKIIHKLSLKMEKLKITANHIIIVLELYIFIDFLSTQNLYDKFILTLTVVLGLIIISEIIVFITLKYQVITYKKTNKILEKNDAINRRIITQYRILKHNLKDKLLGVKTVSNKRAKELIDDLIKEYNESFYVKNDINEMPTGINGLVFEILYDYKEENLKTTIKNKITSDILESVGARSYNLFCEALGVTLKNALQASKSSEEKLICLEFKESKEKIILSIINTFAGSLDLERIGSIEYTTKEEGHGLGLFSLFGRKNLSVTTTIKNNLFINNIEIKKRLKK